MLKSSLTGDELARLMNYKLANSQFPQEPTTDQFFDDDQFESYRELGYHVAKVSLKDVPKEAWSLDGESKWYDLWKAEADRCLDSHT